jgi:toxin-antitoxin system PIN domain toxin
MKGYPLDVDVLIALAWPNHAQHAAVHAWFAQHRSVGWGTCMVTRLGFVRISSHPSLKHHVSTQDALQKLTEIVAEPDHSFWPEPSDGYANPAFRQTVPNTLTHAQVSDAYLATVALANNGALATLDRDLSQTFAQHCVLVA